MSNGRSVLTGRRALLALAGLLLPGMADHASAQFAVSPVIVQLAHHDDPVDATIRIDNEGEDALRFRVYAMDFDQDVTGNHLFTEAGGAPESCAGRLSFGPDALTVPAGGQGLVQVRLDPGADATCWSMLFVEAPGSSASAIQVNQRIGVKLYGLGSASRTDGGIVEAAAARDGERLAVRFAFDNPGDLPVRPSGAIELRDALGGVVSSAPIPAFSVLPRHRRDVEVELPLDDVPAGRYVVVPMVDFGADFLAGAQVDVRLE